MLEQGWTLAAAAEAAGCSARTAAKWLASLPRGRSGVCSIARRAPLRSPVAAPAGSGCEAIEALRRLRMTAAEIAEVLELPLSTVSLWLKRIGLGQALAAGAARAAEPLRAPPPGRARPRRHQEARPDLSARRRPPRARSPREPARSAGSTAARRGVTGYEYLHVMIDDHSRLAYAEVLDDLTAAARSPSSAAPSPGLPSAASKSSA